MGVVLQQWYSEEWMTLHNCVLCLRYVDEVQDVPCCAMKSENR